LFTSYIAEWSSGSSTGSLPGGRRFKSCLRHKPWGRVGPETTGNQKGDALVCIALFQFNNMAKTYKDQVLVSLEKSLQDRSFEMKDLHKKTWPDGLREAVVEFLWETPSVSKSWLSEMIGKRSWYIPKQLSK
jgi:hypothetical protein